MSDLSYWVIWAIGYTGYKASARSTVLHAERVRRPGGYILAANHHSPYDVAGLMATAPRYLDFLSIVEFARHPLVGPFFRAMNCTFLDRGRRDPAAARQVLERLAKGRVVAMFPEGGIRKPDASVTAGGPFNPGVVRLAQISGCPILPAVILDTIVYANPARFLPLKSARFGVNYGEPIHVTDRAAGVADLAAAFVALNDELRRAMPAQPAAETGVARG
jgi:1-acyl-sn-glycerol-3-phosphate acyltransferase